MKDLRVELTSHGRCVVARLLRDGTLCASGDSIETTVGLANEVERVFGDHTKPPTPAQLKGLGKKLARAAFPGPIAKEIEAYALEKRFRLWIDAMDEPLAQIPWEFVWLDGTGHLAYHPLAILLRGVEQNPVPSLLRQEESRILLVLSNPSSGQYANLEHARTELENAEVLLKRAGFQVRTSAGGSKAGFIREIEDFKPDLVHFIGHGVESATGGGLVFESDGQPGFSVLYGEEVAEAIIKARTKIAILSGCQTVGSISTVGASISEFSGCTVVGMQMPIRDVVATVFCPNLYVSLIAGDGIDVAVHKARISLCGCNHEWGIPVLAVGTKPQAELRTTTSEVTGRLNYPPDLRPLVGRGAERKALWEKLRNPAVRLVTVFGMGGMGKTRLAREVGEDLQYDFADGVSLVECDTLSSDDEILGAIAKAVQVDAASGFDGLVSGLRDSKRLLILDCFETKVKHAGLIERLLLAARGLKVLVTSRIILNLPSVEHTFELEGLQKTKGKGASPRISLFVQAAQQSQPGFALTAKNLAIVEALVDLLQGVPLALLLAAGRLRYIELDELHSRLQTRLLDEIQRSAKKNDRHASIRIVIKDSIDLLAEREHDLLVQLSVFAGGFSLSDAKAVCYADAEVERGVFSLYDQSLLFTATQESERRFCALDTIREYMAELAHGPDFEDIQIRHARYFARKADLIREMFKHGDEVAANALLWLDIGNFRQAVKKATRLKSREVITDLARSLSRPFLEAGMQSDFAAMASLADNLAKEENDIPLQIELRSLRAALASRKGNRLEAERLWMEGAKLSAVIGDRQMELECYLEVANSALKDNRPSRCNEIVELVRKLESNLPQGRLVATCHLLQAQMHLQNGEIQTAIESVEAALQQPDEEDYYVWITVARIYVEVGRDRDSIPFCRRVIDKAVRSNYAHNACVGLIDLSQCLESLDAIPEASRAARVALWISKKAATTLVDRASLRCADLDGKGKATDPAYQIPKGTTDWRSAVRSFLDQVLDF